TGSGRRRLPRTDPALPIELRPLLDELDAGERGAPGRHLRQVRLDLHPGQPPRADPHVRRRADAAAEARARAGRAGACGRLPVACPVRHVLRAQPLDPEADPCTLAAWPLVAFDGTIVACCNQTVVDGPAPDHLRIGHAATDDWQDVRERYLRSTLLRAIRTYGPEYVANRFSERVSCDGYCS